jgi:alpha-beta hydrolase superfamily lysophospholipase
MTKTLASGFVLGLLGLAACLDIPIDQDETAPKQEGPIVQFDPAESIIPFPNNLVLNPMTGKVSLPAQCGESIAATVIRTSLLNKLDGFGSYESAMQVTFSAAVDTASLTNHVLLYDTAATGTATPIPVTVIAGTTKQFDAGCTNPHDVASLTIIAQGALRSHGTYVAAITRGIKTTTGTEFGASFTWSLIDQAAAPVTFNAMGQVTENHTPLNPLIPDQLEQLKGIDLLYKAHKPALDFLAGANHARAEILVAWSFTTQTTTDALDPMVAGSPAASITASPLLGNVSLPATIDRTQLPYNQCPDTDSNTQCFLKIALGRGVYTAGNVTCGQVGCAAVADVLGSKLVSKSYQQDTPNPLAGKDPVPGQWNDPVHPTVIHTSQLDVLTFVPVAAIPAAGTVVYGHGLGSNKESVFAIGPQLASQGFATAAIDFVAHGARVIQTSNDAARGCGGTPDPSLQPQCFAQFLSSDLAGTRDNVRQTVLDLEGLVAALKACGATNCGALKVDPAHLAYIGISLGGIIGSMTVASVPDFKGAVLNVPGVGLLDILENTANLQIRCGLVDALISVGIIVGAPFNPGNPPTTPPSGTCLTDAWKMQPGYQQFSVVGRWALDPADGANFTRKLAGRRFLIQEVVNDEVVPNIATDREAALVGLAAAAANADPFVPDPQNPTARPPSAAITTMPMTNKFVRYRNLAPTATPPFPGNTFSHGSLLLPATTVLGSPGARPACNLPDPTGCDGLFGTIRVQVDAITYLVFNH